MGRQGQHDLLQESPDPTHRGHDVGQEPIDSSGLEGGEVGDVGEVAGRPGKVRLHRGQRAPHLVGYFVQAAGGASHFAPDNEHAERLKGREDGEQAEKEEKHGPHDSAFASEGHERRRTG